MRINNNIRSCAITHEWHILLWNNISHCSFLPVATREFITNHRFSHCAKSHFRKTVPIAVSIDIILVNVHFFRGTEYLALVFVLNDLCMVVSVLLNGRDFRNNNIAVFNQRILRNNAFAVDFIVIPELHSFGLARVGFTPDFFVAVDFLLVLVFFGMINGRLE